jgi:type VI secretion system secreted protein Hcp
MGWKKHKQNKEKNMAIPAYMKIKGIPGSVNVAGREECIEVLEFDHQVYLPTDRDDGTITGTRKHDALVIHKAFDKASSLLYQKVCRGETLDEILISWYKITNRGEEVAYFEHKLEHCKIAGMRSYMHNVKDRHKDQFVHQEAVTIRYEKITWNYLDGNLQHTDEWNSR